MSSIAYISDDKLLENCRLNQSNTINFWRLSTNINFKEFGIGSLLFFLSKDKKHQNINKEKGIIGFGRVKDITISSPEVMWIKYEKINGYNSKQEFFTAIKKANKDHLIPEKISSLLLENVCFFQNPIYLSELGINISKSVESYVYIKNDEAVINILDYGKDNIDLWSKSDKTDEIIESERIGLVLSLIKNKTNEDSNIINDYLKLNPIYSRIDNSLDLYNYFDYNLTIVLYHDEQTNKEKFIERINEYKNIVAKYYGSAVYIMFKTIDNIEIPD